MTDLTSSQHLKKILAILPPLKFDRTEEKIMHFEVIRDVHPRIFIKESFLTGVVDKVPVGIQTFQKEFKSGTILPNGEILLEHDVIGWRIAFLEYVKGWKVTILNCHFNQNTSSHHVTPKILGDLVASIEDHAVQSDVIRRISVEGHNTVTTFRELLLYIHASHCNIKGMLSLPQESILELFAP